jgi:hypothetical protein
MAELQGLRVARAIAAEISASEPPDPFDGKGYCPIELGTGAAARVDGDWYATPEPIVTIDGPSAERAAEKADFEREHLAHWFGECATSRTRRAGEGQLGPEPKPTRGARLSLGGGTPRQG